MSGNIELKISPFQKESTCSNTLNFVNVLAGFSYLVYNFYIEFGNWDKIRKSYETSNVEVDKETNETTYWVVSVTDEAESQVMRLEEVCKNIQLIEFIFLCTLAVTAVYSGISFIMRQYKICVSAVKCNDTQWSISMLLIYSCTIIQSMVGLFIVMLLSPTSFMTCYKNIARYFCTIAISVLISFFIFNVILSSLSKPILTHKIQYTELQVVGENCEIDVVREKSRQKRKRHEQRYDDEEEIELVQGKKKYSDNKYDEEGDTV